ncbi:hypothetical protein ACIA5A_06120 [Micromonospora sp. NPDC051300]
MPHQPPQAPSPHATIGPQVYAALLLAFMVGVMLGTIVWAVAR